MTRMYTLARATTHPVQIMRASITIERACESARGSADCAHKRPLKAARKAEEQREEKDEREVIVRYGAKSGYQYPRAKEKGRNERLTKRAFGMTVRTRPNGEQVFRDEKKEELYRDSSVIISYIPCRRCVT